MNVLYCPMKATTTLCLEFLPRGWSTWHISLPAFQPSSGVISSERWLPLPHQTHGRTCPLLPFLEDPYFSHAVHHLSVVSSTQAAFRTLSVTAFHFQVQQTSRLFLRVLPIHILLLHNKPDFLFLSCVYYAQDIFS